MAIDCIEQALPLVEVEEELPEHLREHLRDRLVSFMLQAAVLNGDIPPDAVGGYYRVMSPLELQPEPVKLVA